MEKLYDYIASKYDSSLIHKIYGISLRKLLDYGVDYRYIDDIYVLKMFHDIYLDVKDKFADFYLEDIKNVSDKYLFLIGRISEYNKFGNYNRSNFTVTHNTYVDTECINYVKENSKVFSLNEMFSLENDRSWFCGVCLISKVQTVCIYNDDTFGYMGSGYHNDSFHEIMKSIYNERFIGEAGEKYDNDGQDIKVSFSNKLEVKGRKPIRIIKVFVDIPVPINTSQLESLKILNDEIKKYEKIDGIKMEVSTSIINYFDKDFYLEFDNYNNLDEVIKWTVISDSYKPFYEDKNIVGFINGENHFNDGIKNNSKQK